MKRSMPLIVLATLTLFLTACPQTVTPPPQPPVTPNPDPTTFPVTAVTGTLLNWTGGEAYLTLAAGYAANSTPEAEEVTLVPPVYQTRLSAAGAFTVPLGVPAAAELVTLHLGSVRQHGDRRLVGLQRDGTRARRLLHPTRQYHGGDRTQPCTRLESGYCHLRRRSQNRVRRSSYLVRMVAILTGPTPR